MALSVTGFLAEAEAAYDWSRRHQRPDGSWPIRTVRGTVTDHGIDSNFCAYIAVGVWHHYMITGDTAFLDRMWPTVWSAIDLVCRFQRPDGAFRWGGDHRTHAMFDEASSPATRASTTPSTARSGSPRRSTSPTTSGCVRSRRSGRHSASGSRSSRTVGAFDGLVLPGARWCAAWTSRPRTHRSAVGRVRGARQGCALRRPRPWVTGAETSELALALDALGDTADASN